MATTTTTTRTLPVGMALVAATLVGVAVGMGVSSIKRSICASSSSPKSSSKVAPRTGTLNVLLVRHAESGNNVIADEIFSRGGESPYVDGSDAMLQYERRRSDDPALSPHGQRQAAALPQHSHFGHINLRELARDDRVRLYSSPMLRSMLTSRPLANHLFESSLSSQRHVVEVRRDLCEIGGHYCLRDGQLISSAGTTPSAINATFPDYDTSSLDERGWWYGQSQGRETADEAHQRIDRVVSWLKQLTYEYHVSYHASSGATRKADHIVVVAHADFLNELLVRLKRISNPPQYSFFFGNTSVTHLEMMLSPISAPPSTIHTARTEALATLSSSSATPPDHTVSVTDTAAPTPASSPPSTSASVDPSRSSSSKSGVSSKVPVTATLPVDMVRLDVRSRVINAKPAVLGSVVHEEM